MTIKKFAFFMLFIGLIGCEREEPENWYDLYFSQVYSGDPAVAGANPNNIDRMLVVKINDAKYRIDAALHELDSDRIANALINAKKRGVQVRLITETDYEDEISISAVRQGGIPIKTDEGRGGLMHNKFLVFDQRAVWTGSFNTTTNDATKNNNNAIFIRSETTHHSS